MAITGAGNIPEQLDVLSGLRNISGLANILLSPIRRFTGWMALIAPLRSG
jgi:hypothetical protein